MKSVKAIEPGKEPGDEPPLGCCNPEANLHGKTRPTNATHASTTDPEAKLYKKSASTEARLAFLGHALMENRCGLVVDACLTQANGHAERLAALAMIEKHADRPCAITLGADKGYDTSDFVNGLRSMNVRPHVARRLVGSAIDRRTTRHFALRHEPAHSQAHRGGVRLDEDHRRYEAADAARHGARRMGLHLRRRRLHSVRRSGGSHRS